MEGEVDAGMAVLGIGLLPDLEEAHHLPPHLHDQSHDVGVGGDRVGDVGGVLARPPAGDLRGGEDMRERGDVVLGRRAQSEPVPLQLQPGRFSHPRNLPG